MYCDFSSFCIERCTYGLQLNKEGRVLVENQVKRSADAFLFSIIALLLVCGSVYAYISSALGPVDSGNKRD